MTVATWSLPLLTQSNTFVRIVGQVQPSIARARAEGARDFTDSHSTSRSVAGQTTKGNATQHSTQEPKAGRTEPTTQRHKKVKQNDGTKVRAISKDGIYVALSICSDYRDHRLP